MTKIRVRCSYFALSAALAILAAGGPAVAAPDVPTQAPDADAMKEGDQAGIVVTARRSKETLQDVPLSITALTGDALDKRGVKSLGDLNRLAPSLNFQQAGGRSTTGNRLFFRGLTTGITGNSKASVFLDGVYFGTDYNWVLLNPTMLDHVELLPGPQSAQFGRSSFSGAVNFVTKTPGNHVSGEMSSEIASLGQRQISGYVDGPIVGDTLKGFLTGSYYTFGGPDRWRTSSGYSVGDQRTYSIAGKLIWRPAPNLKITGFGSYNNDRDHLTVALVLDPAIRNSIACSATRPNGTVARYICGDAPTIYDGGLQTDYNTDGLDPVGMRRHQERGALTASWDILGHNITLIGAHDHETMLNYYDADVTSLENLRYYGRNYRKDDSAELRITSPQHQALRYSFGAYYLRFDNYMNNNYFTVHTVSAMGAILSPGTQTFQDIDALTIDKSIYGAVYYDILPGLTLSGESRYQWEKISSRNNRTDLFLEKTFPAFLPRTEISYKITPDIMVYALYSIGNNPGTFNTGLVNDESQRSVPEEKLYNYEAGIKSKWFDNLLTVDLSAYHMDWKKIQSSRSIIVNGVQSSIQESHGSARIDGFELLTALNPTRGLNLRGTVSYNYGRYTSFCSVNAATIFGYSSLPAPDNCLYVNGNRLEVTPPLQASLTADYSWHIGEDIEPFVGMAYAYTSGMWDSEMNLTKSAPANTLNIQAGASFKRIEVTAFIRNLTNEDSPVRIIRYPDPRLTSATANNSSLEAFPRIPRQFGVSVKYRF